MSYMYRSRPQVSSYTPFYFSFTIPLTHYIMAHNLYMLLIPNSNIIEEIYLVDIENPT